MQTDTKPQNVQFSQLSSDDEDSAPKQQQGQADGDHQARKLNKPKPQMQSRYEIEKLIESSPDEEILLNIVKCNFDATVEDVISTFVTFNFVKCERYNPGSFSLVFKSKEAAKEFLYTTKETKLKGRGFWIKFPIHFQKTHKVPDNINREHPLNVGNKKFNDAPSKHSDNYNRRNINEDNEQQAPNIGLFRSDQRQVNAPINPDQQPAQQQHQHYKKPYNNQRQKDEDDGWETVQPHHMNYGKPQYQNNRNNKPRQQQRK